MKSSSNLKSLLKNIDRKGYPAYKSTQGTYDFGTYFLSIDHVQGDPFASPSKLSIHVKGRSAGFPASFYAKKKSKNRIIRINTGILSNMKQKIKEFYH